MLEMSLINLTLNTRATLPALPADGFTLERPQSFNEFPILGSYPQVQSTAPGTAKMTMLLDLWGDKGDTFFREFLEPAFGYKNGLFQPHLLQVAWGSEAKDAFTGRPMGGLPSTKHELGRAAGTIFARTFELALITVQNKAPRVVDVKTGNVVSNATISHTVRQGDDLGRIAKRYGTSVAKISELNNFPPFRPPVGIKLVVPR